MAAKRLPLKLRVFEDDGVPTDEIIAWLRERSPTHFVVRHAADADDSRPHFHALVWYGGAQSFRVQLTKAFAVLKGNRMYSVGELPDADAVASYERYMCHASGDGDRVEVLSRQAAVDAPAGHYNDMWCMQQNAEFWRARRAYKRVKDDSKENDVVRLERRCREAGATTRRDVGEQLVSMFAADKRGMNVFHMRAIVNTVCVRLFGGDERRAIVDEIIRL